MREKERVKDPMIDRFDGSEGVIAECSYKENGGRVIQWSVEQVRVMFHEVTNEAEEKKL